MNIPRTKLKKTFMRRIETVVGENNFSLKDTDRLNYCRDANFRAAIQAHYSTFENLPALVVWPQTADQVSAVLKLCREHKFAVTPYGGGSGVCGGAIPYNGAVIMDTKKMNRVLHLNKDKLVVEAQTGILGLTLEHHLNRNGCTLGHFPASILSASLGGYLAARSAGQQSSKYGKIEDMTLDVEFVDACGRIHQTADVSRSSGLDFTQMIVGSEGTLGVITRARLKIFPKPQHRVFQAFSFVELKDGVEALHRIMQTGMKPDVLRLYDPADSLLAFAHLSGPTGKVFDLSRIVPAGLKKYLPDMTSSVFKLLIRSHRVVNDLTCYLNMGCVLVVMLEGHKKIILEELNIIRNICTGMKAKNLHAALAENWHRHRYSVSYQVSKLFNNGAFADTMEAATTWDNVMNLYEGVTGRLKLHALVLAHISHVYSHGAAIYFTVVAPLKGLDASLKNYDEIWQTAMDAVQEFGGVLSHHHGIGRLKRSHIRAEWGEAKHLYKNLKNYFDPENILNPEVLCAMNDKP